MTIFQKINELRAKKQELFARAESVTDPAELTQIKDEMLDLSNQISDLEQIRDEMADNAQPVSAQPKQATAAPTLGDILQQAAARELQTRGMRVRGVTLNAGDPSGQNVSNDEDGGYLLNPTISRGLLESLREGSFFLPKVRRLTVGPDSNSVVMPYLKDKDRQTGSRFGGVRAYWMDEAEKYTPSQIKFATRNIALGKLGALGFATEEMLRDSNYLESIMRNAFRNEMTWQVDEAVLFGLGTREGETLQPTGLLNTTASTGNVALLTVAKETGQAAGSVTFKNILALWNRMSPENRSKAVWMINPDLETMLIQMLMQTGTIETGETALAQGMPVYMPANGLSTAPYGTLLGRPVVPNEHMAAAGALGDIAFIDPTEYFWIDRDGMKEATSIHVRFEYDEMAFKFTYRCNGMPTWYSPTTPPKGGTTRSPYVVLGARA